MAGPIKDPLSASRFGPETEAHLNRLDYGGGQLLSSDDMAIGNDVDAVISLEAVSPIATAQ